jgi:MFS family permease
MQGVGGSLAWAGALTWLIAASPVNRRGEMLGTAIGSAIFGALFGPVIGALADHVGPREVFVGLAGLTVVLAVLTLRTPGAAAEPPAPGALSRALRDFEIRQALWLMSVPALAFGIEGVLIPLKLDQAGWSAAGIAVAWVVSAAIEMVLAPLIGRVSDRKGRLLPLRVALMGAVAVLIGFAFADRPALIVPILILSGITFGGFWAPAMALLTDAADRIGLAQGLAFGLMNLAWGAGNAVGPAIGGAIADAAGDAVPFLIMAALCLATLGSLGFAGTRRVRVPESS